MPDRAKIEAVDREAVARVLDRMTNLGPSDAMYVADEVLAALDRVRDARGDDEAVVSDDGASWRCVDCQCINAMHEAFCFRCGAGQPEFSARSPQGEDHEAGLEAATHVLHGYVWHERLSEVARATVDAYLSRVAAPSPARDARDGATTDETPAGRDGYTLAALGTPPPDDDTDT